MKNKYFIPAYIFGVLILISASLPTEEVEKAQESHFILGIILSDYFLHFFTFGVLSVLLCYGFYNRKKSSIPYLRIGLYSIGYGIFIEIYQITLPYRSFSLDDLISDAVGIVVFLFIFKKFIARRK